MNLSEPGRFSVKIRERTFIEDAQNWLCATQAMHSDDGVRMRARRLYAWFRSDRAGHVDPWDKHWLFCVGEEKNQSGVPTLNASRAMALYDQLNRVTDMSERARNDADERGGR